MIGKVSLLIKISFTKKLILDLIRSPKLLIISRPR